jgi:hypothetical protein
MEQGASAEKKFLRLLYCASNMVWCSGIFPNHNTTLGLFCIAVGFGNNNNKLSIIYNNNNP